MTQLNDKCILLLELFVLINKTITQLRPDVSFGMLSWEGSSMIDQEDDYADQNVQK